MITRGCGIGPQRTLLKAIAVTLWIALWASRVAAAAPLPLCPNPQSPRNINPNAKPSPYNGQAPASSSMIRSWSPDRNSLIYRARCDGPDQTLYRCGQHYHFLIETPQGCPGEESGALGIPKPGSWVEVHTVYAAVVRKDGCNPEKLDCCVVGPFLVYGFSARVTGDEKEGPIVLPLGYPLAEWSGSSTGPAAVEACLMPVLWSFRLTCDLTVSLGQLRGFPGGFQPARALQSDGRVSKDLTFIKPR